MSDVQLERHMQQTIFRRHLTALALAAAVFGPSAGFAAPAPSRVTAPALAPVDRAPLRLTERDVTASNEKVALAYRHLVGTWTDAFAGIGARFVAPQLARYRG